MHLGRGLEADRDALIERLRFVNYYRLSRYLYPFRNPEDSFQSGTTLDKVWHRYTFDRRLRLILLDAIERVEVAVKEIPTVSLMLYEVNFSLAQPQQPMKPVK